MAENPLEKELTELREKLQEKDVSINSYLDRIELLEDNILKLESLIDEAQSKGGSFDSEKVQETKLTIELAEKDKKLRELKDKMGFLRKENLTFRKKLEALEKASEKGASKSTIEIEEETPTMNALIKELQSKINKQKQLINELQKEGGAYASSSKYEEKLEEKDKKIEELEVKLESLSEKEPSDVITKSLTEELQMKLNRTRQQLKSLQEKLNQYEESKVPIKEPTEDKELNELKTNHAKLKEQLEEKNTEIENLTEKISILEEELSKAPEEPAEEIPKAPVISDLTKELQNKLNKRKQTINELHAEIKRLKETISTKSTQDESITQLKEELQSKAEKIKQLKSQIDEREKIIEEADVSKLDSLRVNELKRMIKELEKLTNQQRTEIYELKK
jgi:chromosome segregation ATPase